MRKNEIGTTSDETSYTNIKLATQGNKGNTKMVPILSSKSLSPQYKEHIL